MATRKAFEGLTPAIITELKRRLAINPVVTDNQIRQAITWIQSSLTPAEFEDNGHILKLLQMLDSQLQMEGIVFGRGLYTVWREDNPL
jgi:Zn-dependent M16 (insulinase) family peptidase